jgi:hypothetical protein
VMKTVMAAVKQDGKGEKKGKEWPNLK